MARTRPTAALGVALALVLTACGGEDPTPAAEHVADAGDGTDAQDVDTAAGADAQDVDTAAGADAQDVDTADGEAEVALRNIAFSPEKITVDAGTTVTFTNEDVVRHTVTSGEPGGPDGTFDEDLPDQGDVAELTFDEPGTFVYFCDLHRDMAGEIVVR